MGTSIPSVVRSVVGAALLVAAGSCIAAANSYTSRDDAGGVRRGDELDARTR